MADRTHVCGPAPDPNDPLMEHDPARGHVPADLNPNTQRWEWHRNGADQ